MHARLGQVGDCGKLDSQVAYILRLGRRGGDKPTLTVNVWSCMVLAMARNKISTTVYITAEQNQQLKLLHQKTKVPVAEYIRQGIDLILERERVHLPGQLTLDVIRK